MNSLDCAPVDSRLTETQCLIALSLMFFKLYSPDNYVPNAPKDIGEEQYRKRFEEWLLSSILDLDSRLNNVVIKEEHKEENHDKNSEAFIHWLYVGVLRRRFPGNFEGTCCWLISSFPWSWSDEFLSQACKSMSTRSQTNDGVVGMSRSWNHEILPLEGRPKL